MSVLITVATIKALPRTQRDAFGQICLGNDGGISPRTGDALVGKGLVKIIEQQDSGPLPFKIRRYDVASIAAHMAWCEWASMQEEG